MQKTNLQWTVSLAYVAFVVITGFLDAELSAQPMQGITSVAGKVAVQPIFYMNIFTLAIVIVTAYMDWRIWLVNANAQKTR
jgi:hypothetical protein